MQFRRGVALGRDYSSQSKIDPARAEDLNPDLGLRRLSVYAHSPSQHTTLTLVNEFLTTSLFIAVTTGIIAARAQGRAVIFAGDITAYMPKPPDLFARLVTVNPQAFFDRPLSGHLNRIYQKLAFARQLVPTAPEAWGSTTLEWPGIDFPATDWTAVHKAWQPLCADVRVLLLVLLEMDLMQSSEEVPRLYEIEPLVKAAHLGGTPCVRADGTVFVPQWLDYRREKRIPMSIPVLVEHDQGQQPVLLANISTHGAGLSSCASLAVGARLTVVLPNRDRLSGVVVWCNGSHLGMKFDAGINESGPVWQEILNRRRATATNDDA